MVVTTANEVSGREIATYHGVVRGIVLHGAKFNTGVGYFNVKETEKAYELALEEAFQRMVANAQQIGADAIIAMRYVSVPYSPHTTEVLAYGTAVRLR